jgi:hypothetical protein
METVLSTSAPDIAAPVVTGSRGGSAASWGSIIAGAFVAASVSLILLALGAGLGFAELSPWAGRGVTATTFAVTTAIWLIVMQWVSAGLGGYIAGRLRTRWVGTHTHEVFFRDTAHGLVTWAVATVLVASLAASSVSSLLAGGMHGATAVAADGANLAMPSSRYGIDKLFRGAVANNATAADYRGEATQILATAVSEGSLSPADRTYLAGVVAQKTGVSPEDAQKRVDEALASANDAATKAKVDADAARKAAAEASIYTALSLLMGAFIASVSAALGGRLRDEHP